MTSYRDNFLLLLILPLAFFMFYTGIEWGLPSDERASFYYHDPAAEFAEQSHPMALQPYHPDEPVFVMAISNMEPSELDFNPKFFIYPTLHIYLVAIALKVSSLFNWLTLAPSKEFYFEHVDQVGNIYLIGRTVSAIFGVGVVLFTYLLGRKLFKNSPVALLAALFISVLPAFVVHSHYMTVDVPVTFWILVTIYFSSYIIESNRIKWYVLAGLSAGLAASTKYYAILIIITIITAHFIRLHNNRTFRRSGEGGILNTMLVASYTFAVLGFIVTSPYTILDFKEFYKSGILSWFVTIFKGETSDPEIRLFAMDTGIGWFNYLLNGIPTALGWPFFILSGLGIFYALFVRKSGVVLLLSWLITYFFIIGVGATSARHIRYLIPLFPVATLLTALFVYHLYKGTAGVIRKSWVVICICVFIYTLAYSASHLNLLRAKDNRDSAAEWIRNNVTTGSVIGVGWEPAFYTPPLNKNRYNVEVLTPLGDKFNRWRIINHNPKYMVFSEFEYRQYIRLKDRFPEEARFFSQLLEGKLFDTEIRYKIHRFNNGPKLLGIDFDWKFPPHDWIYTHPEIMIFERM